MNNIRKLYISFLFVVMLFNLFSITSLADDVYWHKDGNYWMYFENGNVVKNRWVYSDNNWYYLNDIGIMETQTVIDGYYVDRFGVCFDSKNKFADIIKNSLLEACTNGKSSSFVFTSSNEDFEKVYKDLQKMTEILIFMYDIPLSKYYIWYTIDDTNITFEYEKLHSTDDSFSLDKYKNYLSNVKELSKRLLSLDDIITYIIDRNEYSNDYNNLKDNTGYNGLFGNNKTRCLGYASAFHRLLTEKGIRNRLVIGNLDGNNKDEINHAWNEVYLDGRWVKYDLTYFDSLKDREYLDISDENSNKYNVILRVE